MSPAPAWTAPTPGEATRVGFSNQFLTAHAASLVYQGATLLTPPTIGVTADQVGNGALAHKFSFAGATNITSVDLAIGAVGSGADVLVSIQADSGGGVPSGTPLVAAILPAEWLTAGASAAYSSFRVPLTFAATGGTTYYLVIQPGCQLAGGAVLGSGLTGAYAAVNDTEWTRSTAGTGAFTYNATTATWTGQAYGYSVRFWGGTSGSVRTFADDTMPNQSFGVPAKVDAYGYNGSGQVGNLYTWAGRNLTAVQNLLCRDDASFEGGLGSWFTGANCTLAQSAVRALTGTKSMLVTSSGAGNQQFQTNNNLGNPLSYNVTAGVAYTAIGNIWTATAARLWHIDIAWYNAGGFISRSTAGSAAITANQWNAFSFGATAPAGATKVILSPIIQGAVGAAEQYWTDAFGLQVGNGTTWSFPGVGVGSARAFTYTGGVLTSIA